MPIRFKGTEVDEHGHRRARLAIDLNNYEDGWGYAEKCEQIEPTQNFTYYHTAPECLSVQSPNIQIQTI